ncbi:MAG: OsmC family protein [Nevskia sp.]|nr:OsmC family protein [Nevskia sp.]
MSNPIKVHKAPEGKLKQLVEAGANALFSDEPPDVGDGGGLDPHELLDAALGACTAMTVTLVARRKQMPLADVRVTISHVEDNDNYRLSRSVELVGELTAEQRQYLLGIANKCPIHRALLKKISIDTVLAGAA